MMQQLPAQPVAARRPPPAVPWGPPGGAGGVTVRRDRRPFRDHRHLVYILDPDAAACEALATTLRREGFQASVAGDVETFNAALARRRPDLALVNAEIGGADGLAVLRRARASRRNLPVFVLQDRPLVELAVAAMKAGAADVLIKPLDPERLLLLVQGALRQPRHPRLRPPERQIGFGGSVELTRREREVLQLIASGHSNREAGEHLGISQRTIEVHRARVMEKFGARNAADLMRIVLTG
jgi:FixJ family two-component response regulator